LSGKNREDLPSVSIVLLNLNGEEFSRLWSALFELNYPRSKYEIVFVDNGSMDRSVEIFQSVAQENPEVAVRMVRNNENLGYSKGNNVGVKEAKGKYVVLLSNDILVDANWLVNMIKALESNHSIGVAQSSMYLLSDVKQVDIGAHFIDKLGYCFRAHPSADVLDIYYLQPFTYVTEVFFAEGAVMFFKRSLLEKTRGLFDDDYFMFYEDIDFCWRARLVGYKVCIVPQSRVYHARGGTVQGTLIKLQPRFVFTNTRNRLRTLFKNYDSLNLCRYVPLSVFFEILKSTFLFVKGKRVEGREALRGVLAFIMEIPRLLSKRRIVQEMRTASDKDVVRLMHPLNRSIRNLLLSSRELSKALK
jgi:GT2 family glycosyltransferase